MRKWIGIICVFAVGLNLLNLAVMGLHPLPLVSAILCAHGAYHNLR